MKRESLEHCKMSHAEIGKKGSALSSNEQREEYDQVAEQRFLADVEFTEMLKRP